MANIENNIIDVGTDTYIAIVKKIDVANRTCDVFIPKLMMAMNSSELIRQNYSIDTSNLKDAENIKLNTSITKINYFRVYAEDVDEPMPELESTVSVYFLDGNIRLGYWTKFNPNGNYSVIEEERYPLLATIQVGSKTIQLHDQDNINIIIPEDFSVNLVEDGKNKTLYITDNLQLNTSIGNLKQYISDLQSNMTYLVDKKRAEEINNIKSKELTNINPEGTITDTDAALLYNKMINYQNEIDLSANTSFNDITNISEKINKQLDGYNTIINEYNNLKAETEKENSSITNDDLNNAKEALSIYGNSLYAEDFDSTYTAVLEEVSPTKKISIVIDGNELLSDEVTKNTSINLFKKYAINAAYTKYFNETYEETDDDNKNNVGILSFNKYETLYAADDIPNPLLTSDDTSNSLKADTSNALNYTVTKSQTLYGNLIKLSANVSVVEEAAEETTNKTTKMYYIIVEDTSVMSNTTRSKTTRATLDPNRYNCILYDKNGKNLTENTAYVKNVIASISDSKETDEPIYILISKSTTTDADTGEKTGTGFSQEEIGNIGSIEILYTLATNVKLSYKTQIKQETESS